MATRTTYTSTIRVPIYASWRCPKCHEVNYSEGIIACQNQVTTSSLRRSKQEEAKAEASNRTQNEWIENALGIIFNPRDNAHNIRHDLFMQNTNCTKCGLKPKWDKGMGYLTISMLALMPAIISGIVAFSMLTSFVAWLIFVVTLSAVAYGFISEKLFKKTIANLPEEFIPVIGSLNKELIVYAEHQGKVIPTPDDTIEIVGSYGKENAP